jgi:hypothetical protein
MRWLYRFLVLLVTCLIAVALPFVPAQAQCGAPFIELSPKYGLPGTRVTIYGHYLTAGKFVDIYYDGAPVVTDVRASSGGDLAYTFNIPEGCSGQYQVLADAGYTEVDTYFTVKPGLTVTPDNGPPGMTVAVKGQGFASSEVGIELLYYLDGSYETVGSSIHANAKGSWETSFQIPTSSRGQHKIDAQGAVSRVYEVEGATFEITAGISIDKSAGFVGDTVTMTGSRFAAYEKGVQILFDDQTVVTDIKADAHGEWEASFPVPDMPTGMYSVTAEGEQTKQEDVGELSFEIEPDIALSPTEGHVGTNLTVAGHGFAASEDVNIMYDGGTVETTKTNGQGSFEVSFPAPESQYGEHQVAAGYAGENHASAIFSMESNHPDAPTLISPSNKGRVGLIGKETPKFEWSAVSDDSGVHYRLQIAASANVTTVGFVDPMVSITGLVRTSYTLNTTEALPSGTYYWIVKAVDGAQNESPWTEPRPFRVGLLPLWAFIVVIVAIVVFIGVLTRALVRRRIIYYDRW